MTRPEIVRADTIDLQDPSTPSAKDHSRQPSSPKPLGDGPPAPHQAQSLRKASLDGYDLHVRSPRASKDLSDKELQLLHDADPDEQDAAAENEQMLAGGQEVVGQDLGTDDEDDDLDDDMMDKISSSPSIDDGGYNASGRWPSRKDSLLQSHSMPEDGERSFEPQKRINQLRRITSNIHNVMRLRAASFSPANFQTEEPECHAAPQRNEFLRSRFRENLDDPGFDMDQMNLEREDECEPEDLAHHSDVVSFNGDFRGQIPYALEIKTNDLSDVGEADDWQAASHFVDSLEDEFLWDDLEDRFVDSGWGGECLREIEDIDFEFVYALHTFVATVEGQANATKGDTMVLLDDSNSYWWLVKVVKDSSIGYLPAEHIETPTERLARLNKHRNIDLSQTMLGDNPEKSRNPLKKAMRKRNQKSVAFAEPQYFEPSEPSYSSDEEGELGLGEQATTQAADTQQQAQGQQAQQLQQSANGIRSEEQSAVIEPLRTQKLQTNGAEELSPTKDANGQPIERDQPRQSSDSMDSEEGTGRRRMRNTDSFYKDDSVETRKISLTPNLLKEDGAAKEKSVAVQEVRTSLDSQKSNEKAPAPTEKDPKKKEKEKKKGVLGGLFKRKNSKTKQDKDKEDRDDLSGTTAAGESQHSVDSVSIESALSSPTTPTTVQVQQQKHGKLQKAPPPAKSSSVSKRTPVEEPVETKSAETETTVVEPKRALSPTTIRQVTDAPLAPAPLQTTQEQTVKAVSQEALRPAEPTSPSAPRGLFSPISTMLSGSSSTEPKEPKPEKTKKAKSRMALEDSEESDEGVTTPQQSSVVSNLPSNLRPVPAPVDTARAANQQRLSESPVEVSPVQQSHLRPAHASTSTADAPPSPLSTNSTPELVDHPSESEGTHANARSMRQGPVVTKTPDVHATPSVSETSSPVTASEQPQWSPAALRTYLDSNGANDVRDLILLVHDTSDVKDLPQSHELLHGFSGDRQRLDAMSKRLDEILGEVLSRRSAPAA